MSGGALSERESLRAEKYDPFRAKLDGVTVAVLEKPLGNMWFSAMLELRRMQKAVEYGENLPQEAIRFWNDFGKSVVDVLVLEARPESIDITQEEPASPARRAIQAIHKVSDIFFRDEDIETEPGIIKRLGFDQLCQMSDRFKVEIGQDEQGSERKYFYIYSPKRDEWIEYPIPNTDKVLHKGGMGRTILKILYNNDPELAESELPPNDFDYIAVKSVEAEEDLKGLRTDPSGVEEVDVINLDALMSNRDLDMNNAFVGRDGLVFAQTAYDAARTGEIAIVSTKRDLYGSEIFFYESTRLIKNRGMMRLLKTLSEEKATSFDLLPLNKQIDLGIYWLILAKRFSDKPDSPLFMDRLFELVKQMGQVHENEENVYDVLDRVHQQYPFFNFDGISLDEEGVARWLGRKLVKQVDKKYRDINEIPSLLDMVREKDDTVPYKVSLRDYQHDPKKLEKIRSQWTAFINRCRRRTTDYLDGSVSDVDEEE